MLGIERDPYVYKYGEVLKVMVEVCLKRGSGSAPDQTPPPKITIRVKEYDYQSRTKIGDFVFFGTSDNTEHKNIQTELVGKNGEGNPVYKGYIDLNLYLDWADASKHKTNTYKFYVVEVDFADNYKREGETLAYSDLICVEYDKKEDDYLRRVQGYNEQMVKIGEESKQPMSYEPCKYSAIVVDVANKPAAQVFTYLKEMDPFLYDFTNQEIQVVAGCGSDGEKKNHHYTR